MSDERPPPSGKPVPLILWAALGFILVLGFMLLMRALNPPELGRTPPTPDVVTPVAPKTTPLPDVEPVSPAP